MVVGRLACSSGMILKKKPRGWIARGPWVRKEPSVERKEASSTRRALNSVDQGLGIALNW